MAMRVQKSAFSDAALLLISETMDQIDTVSVNL